MKTLTTMMLVAAVAGAPSAAWAQKAVTRPGEMIKRTVTIEQIDPATRHVVVRESDGNQETIDVPKTVTRFNELKVGDRVHVTYYTSTVYQVRPAGTSGTSGTTGLSGAITPGQQATPGGSKAIQATETVTIKSLQPEVPALTVMTSSGLSVMRRVKSKKSLENLKPGDHIDITYTEAMLVSVEHAK